jgi:hypothetical protein
MRQYVITPAAGKRLIAKAMTVYAPIKTALRSGVLVIIAGTTNGYIAEEVLSSIEQVDGFSRQRFFRGVSVPPKGGLRKSQQLPDENEFPGDVVIVKGDWQKGKTIFDVIDDLEEGDVILKGANALDMQRRQAAILIAHPKAGTIGVALQAMAGRRVRLILPVGLEKRIHGDLQQMALKINAPGNKGPRLFPVMGEVFTELEAVASLTGAQAEVMAAGGIAGAEGCVWLAVDGDAAQLDAADKLLKVIGSEPEFNF